MTARRALAMVLPVMLLATMGPAVSEAASKRPAVVETRTIGHTVKGRAIVAWRVGQPSSGRRVVVLSAMHGNETGPKRILVNLLDGRRIKGADIWLVPQYNRDGVVRRTRQNAHGVDLNRNYPRHWKRQGGAYNSGPRRGLGAGDQGRDGVPAQDPSDVRRQLPPAAQRRRPGRATRGLRSCGGCTAGLGLPIKSFNCSGKCHGTMTEWFNANFPGVAVTVEYGRGLSRKQATRTGPNGLLSAIWARR